MFDVERIVVPFFGFVLAYNLARPGALAAGVHGRMAIRLTLMGWCHTRVRASQWHRRRHQPPVAAQYLSTVKLVVVLTDLIELGGATRYVMAISLFSVGVLCGLGAWAFCRGT